MPTIGAAIITKNAERHLGNVLASVSFCDQVVVLDSGSTDTTLEIARAHGAEVHTTPDWPGFGPQKQRAIALLKTEWILLLDADEVISPELGASMLKAANLSAGPKVWELNRLSSLCGHWVRHSGWHPEWIARFYRRGSAKMSDDLVHESLRFEGKTGRLDGLMLHHSYDDMSDVLRKLDSYSTAAAKQKFAAGKRASLPGAVFRGAWSFVKSYIFKRGFLDGGIGFMLAVSSAEHSYYRYVKLKLLWEQKEKK